MKSKDIFGKALIDYYNYLELNNSQVAFEDILTWTNISEVDVLPISYLFRSFEDMPKIEQKALDACYGKILDVGCGAGIHSLHLQNTGHEVKGIDVSEGAVEVSRRRGIKNVEHLHLLDVNDKYDTILLLMNGTGIFKNFHKVKDYLTHLKSLLNLNGQVLIDSTDIKYMYENDFQNDNDSKTYYGELEYFISYKGIDEYPMKWLYLDINSLKKFCHEVGLACNIIEEGEHFDYLARISMHK